MRERLKAKTEAKCNERLDSTCDALVPDPVADVFRGVGCVSASRFDLFDLYNRRVRRRRLLVACRFASRYQDCEERQYLALAARDGQQQRGSNGFWGLHDTKGDHLLPRQHRRAETPLAAG